MADILISGYHGFSNSGDDALLRSVIDSLKAEKHDVSIVVLSGNPAETEKKFGVPAIHRYHYFKVAHAMRKSKLLIFGGGSLLQDVTSNKSLYYYLLILSMAQHRNMRTMLFANGIGPLKKKRNRKIATKVLNRVSAITLRDDTSDLELRSMNVQNEHIVITADPVFGLNLDGFTPNPSVVRRSGLPENKPYMVVAIRPWKYAETKFVETIASACDTIAKKYGIVPVFLPMQPSVDTTIAEAASRAMTERSYVLHESLSLSDTLSLISGAEVTIGMRLHTLIYATVLEVPSMALVYDPKVSAFMASINQPLFVNVENMTKEETVQKLVQLIEEREQRTKDLAITNLQLKNKAKENAKFAIELLED